MARIQTSDMEKLGAFSTIWELMGGEGAQLVDLDPYSNGDIGAGPFVPALLSGQVSTYSDERHQILVEDYIFWTPSISVVSILLGGLLHPGADDVDGGGANHLYPVAKVFPREAVGWLVDAEQSKGRAKFFAGFIVLRIDLHSPDLRDRRRLDFVEAEWDIQTECYPDRSMVSDGVPNRGITDSRLCDDCSRLSGEDMIDS